jgi:uncharacterized protein (TIGR04141 family)
MDNGLPKLRLTWFLLKSDIDPDDAAKIIEAPKSGQLNGYRVPVLHATRESLFIKSTPPLPPKWLGYVQQHLDGGELPRILGASSSGLLIITAGKRLFAVSFGYGRWLLREETVVQDFGLRVVVNSVNPAQIRSVDARTFDELTVHTRRGVSHSSPLNAFELDVTRNLLRGITGTSETSELPGQITGSNSLAMNTDHALPELPALAATLLQTYKARRYRTHFRFIDDMRVERDPTTITTLDQKMLEALQAGELTDMHLAIPEAVDWQKIAGVRFSIKQRHHQPTPDPSIATYRSLRDPSKLTVKLLKSDKVEALSALDETQLDGKWRVYECIVYEVQYDGYLYVLSGGDWYRINPSYRGRVEDFIRTLPELDIGLPSARPTDDEDAYNRRAAQDVGALCLDKKLVRTGGPDSVELCDILTADGTYIHIKKRGRSSTLSHLFAQGVNSAELLLHDETFRHDARAIVSGLDATFASTIPSQPQARDQIRVAYVVLSRSRRTDTPHGLPFFSLVSLQAATRHLADAGIHVSVQQIKEIGLSGA